MPYKFETKHIKLPKKYDRRIKLTEEDKDRIKVLRNQGWTYRQLAEEFGVSTRTISFIIKPGAKERNIELRKQRGGSKKYYNKVKSVEAVKETRKYKQHILKKEGII